MEVKYYNDHEKNYMVLRCEDKNYTQSYAYRILSLGKVKGILKSTVQYINDEIYLYVDISSRKTMEQIYQNRKMSYEEIRNLFLQMDSITRELSQYFIEETGLLFSPQYLFYDFSKGSYSGLYFPAYKYERGTYEELMEFLLDHMDESDEQLTENIYEIYETVEQGCFNWHTAISILDKNLEVKKEEPRMLSQENSMKIEVPVNENPLQIKQVAKFNIFYPIMSILFLVTIGGILYAKSYFTFTYQEQMTLWACIILMSVCSMFGIALTIKQMIKRKEVNIREETLIQVPSVETQNIPIDQIVEKDLRTEMLMNKVLRTETESCNEKLQEEENTVFFDRENMIENKLYAMDKKNKQHIMIDHFPYTIGSLAGYVDCTLSDKSVSRIHVQIDKNEERIFLTDMNSTNGTFKNGRRMQPQETVEIEPGDEVRIGKLNYCFR